MNTISLTLSKSQQDLLHTLYHEYEVENNNAYIAHQYRPMDCVISLYTSGKAVFQGKSAEEYASAFQVTETTSFEEHAGSDEVGTGDFFGPICVCAAKVTKKDVSFLESLGVKDSKQITDEVILRIAPQIMERVPYALLILNNVKYNEVNPTNNMNEMKAKLHNQCYINLSKKTALPKKIVIDQFCEEKTYYRYLKDMPYVVGNIYFTPRAENQFLAVACGAIISRYAFLKSMEKMSETYHFSFPKGAGSAVDEAILKFVKEYGKEELRNVAKLNFKNIQKVGL